jgi:hypothetical protein
MLRILLAAFLFAAVSQCQPPAGQAWRASKENGDNPGMGYELRSENGKVAGDAYILNPGYPNDFSHGRRTPMTIVGQSPGELTVRVSWSRDLTATLRFRFKPDAWPDSFQANVAEIIGSEAYDAENYTFVKVK